MRRIFLLLVIFAIIAGAILWSHRDRPKTNAAIHDDSITTQRAVIWRPYGYDAPPMQICTGHDKCRKVSNLGAITTGVHPYYMTLPDAQKLRVTPQPARIEYLDADPAPLGPGTYESDHAAIRYDGPWIYQRREGPQGGTLHTAMDEAATASLEFEGTGLEVGMLFYDDRRATQMCIDDVCRDVQLFSHGLEWQQPILVYGLKPGRHTMRLRLTAGKAMDIDWVRVIGEQTPLGAGEYLATDPHWFTTAGWQGTSTYALTAGAAFMFTGREVALTFPTDVDAGEIMLCLDGQCQVEDLFSRLPSERTIRASVREGLHSVVLQKGPSRRLTLPKIAIQ